MDECPTNYVAAIATVRVIEMKRHMRDCAVPVKASAAMSAEQLEARLSRGVAPNNG